MSAHLSLSSDTFENLIIPLTDEEWKKAKEEHGGNSATISKVADMVAEYKDQKELEFNVASLKEQNKTLIGQIKSKTKKARLKVYRLANEEEAAFDIYSSMDQQGYALGELIMSVPMSMDERRMYGAPMGKQPQRAVEFPQ